MAPPADRLTFRQVVQAPAAEAYRAFTNATALRDWQCDAAESDPRPGGRLYLWWSSGFYTAGTFEVAEPSRRLAFTWHGTDDPATTHVRVTFGARKDGTLVTVHHEGLGKGRKWTGTLAHLQKDWPASLENLKSVLESGQDLRVLRRPMMGIGGEPLSAQAAERLGVPVKAGVRLDSVAAGSGAQAAALQADDVIVALGDARVTGWESLAPALSRHQAGDTLKVAFWRGAKKHTAQLTLGRRTVPDLPSTPEATAARAREGHRRLNAELEAAAQGLSEEHASRRPAPEEWNFKELLAHYIACERDHQAWIAAMLRDGNWQGQLDDSLEFRPNVTQRLDAIVALHPTVPALLEELRRSQEETAILLGSLPPAFVARKALYNRLASWFALIAPVHGDEHREQMKALVG